MRGVDALFLQQPGHPLFKVVTHQRLRPMKWGRASWAMARPPAFQSLDLLVWREGLQVEVFADGEEAKHHSRAEEILLSNWAEVQHELKPAKVEIELTLFLPCIFFALA